VTEYTLGPKFKVGEVELGDNVTFITKDAYQGTKSGVVARIWDNYSATRRRIFLNEFDYVLNGYPDSVTDCYLNIPKPEKQKERKGVEQEAYKNFLQVPVGSVFGIDLVGPDSHVWVKVGLNTWRFIDISGSKYTSFGVEEHDDAAAFTNLWSDEGKPTFSEDKETGNWEQDWWDE